MNRAIIAVGSNKDPWKNIKRAREAISDHLRLTQESQFRETISIGEVKQPDYINGVWLVETNKTQSQLKDFLKSLEEQLGRIRGEAPSSLITIDLDIVVWNNQVVHPDVWEREFVKQAVLEVEPGITF